MAHPMNTVSLRTSNSRIHVGIIANNEKQIGFPTVGKGGSDEINNGRMESADWSASMIGGDIANNLLTGAPSELAHTATKAM